MQLILASQSPQRSAILRDAGIAFRTVTSNCQELTTAENPVALALANARRKAFAAKAKPGDLILAADTVVAQKESKQYRFFGKPSDRDEARAFLESLAGKEHTVVSGFVFLTGTEIVDQGHATTLVTFHPLTPHQINTYLAEGEWQNRAGGYAIQEKGKTLVENMEGDYFNVVGLPVKALTTAKMLLGVSRCN